MESNPVKLNLIFRIPMKGEKKPTYIKFSSDQYTNGMA